jgi:hypothetical protein
LLHLWSAAVLLGVALVSGTAAWVMPGPTITPSVLLGMVAGVYWLTAMIWLGVTAASIIGRRCTPAFTNVPARQRAQLWRWLSVDLLLMLAALAAIAGVLS